MGDEGAPDRDGNPAKKAVPKRRARHQPTLMGFPASPPAEIVPPSAAESGPQKKALEAPALPPSKHEPLPGPGGGMPRSPFGKSAGLPPLKRAQAKPYLARPLPVREEPAPETADVSPEPAPPGPVAPVAAKWAAAPVPTSDVASAATAVGPPPQPDDPPVAASEPSADVLLPEPEVGLALAPAPAPASDELAGGPADVLGAAPAPLEGESTQVNLEPPTAELAETKPAIEIPEPSAALDYLPHQATEAQVYQPEPPSSGAEASAPVFYDAGRPATQPEPEDFVVESTVVVDSAAMARPAQTYSVDVESGIVILSEEIPGSPTHVVSRPDEKSWIGLLVVVGLAAFALVAAGFATVWFLVLAPETGSDAVADVGGDTGSTEEHPAEDPGATDPIEPGEDDPAESDPSEDPVGEGTDPAGEDPAGEDPAGEDPPAEDPAGEDPTAEEPGEEPPEQAPAAPGAPASREAIDAYELARVPTNRRTRRMTDEERVRQTNRLKARGRAAYRRDEYALAETLYREALGFNSWDVGAVEGMARSTARQGRYPEAIAWANLAVERNSRSAATFRVLGDVWRQAGHDDEALRTWRRGQRRHPEDRHLRQRIRELRRR